MRWLASSASISNAHAASGSTIPSSSRSHCVRVRFSVSLVVESAGDGSLSLRRCCCVSSSESTAMRDRLRLIVGGALMIHNVPTPRGDGCDR